MNLTRKLLSREAFVALFMGAIGGLASLVFGIPIIGFVLAPLIQQPARVWRDVGAVDKFTIGDTVEVVFQYNGFQPWSGPTVNTAAWLRRNSATSFTAFAVYCTHLGCPVHWLPDPKLFLCPCHGSVFDGSGHVLGGPAPRPLFTYATRINNGRVEIKTEPLPVVT